MATPLRTARERELVLATRRLFDERGLQDAPIEAVAQAVGIARGLIYRQFSSKEELFVLTVTTYLDELAERLEAATPDVEALMRAFAGYCLEFPAFLDCSMSLMRRPAGELQGVVDASVWARLGAGMGRCLGLVARVLEAEGVSEPALTSNLLWTQTLGAMHLTRLGVGVGESAPGETMLFRVEPEAVVAACVAAAQAVVDRDRRT